MHIFSGKLLSDKEIFWNVDWFVVLPKANYPNVLFPTDNNVLSSSRMNV